MDDLDLAIDELETTLQKLKDKKATKLGLDEFHLGGIKINFNKEDISFYFNGISLAFSVDEMSSLIERFNMKYRS